MGCSSPHHFRLRLPERICALCGEPILERELFILRHLRRMRYSSHYEETAFGLNFHVKCVKKIHINVENMYDLQRLVRKIEIKRGDEHGHL